MKIKHLLSMAAVALMAAACSNDVNEVLAPEAPALQGIPFTATISPKDMDATTRALYEESDGSLSAQWEQFEEIALSYTVDGSLVITKAIVASVTEGVATISATLDPNVTDGTEVVLVYPFSAVNDFGSYAEPFNLNGDLSDPCLDTRTGSSTIKVSDGTATLKGGATLDPQYAIVKIKLKSLTDGDEDYTAMKELNIELVDDGRVFTIKPTVANTDLYAAMPSVTDVTAWLTATDSDGKPYVAKATVNTSAGKFYQTTLKMATVGDLMNSDGSFSATAETGKTPIGVIAYLGKDNFTEPGVDGGGHGLVMALKNAASGVIWSTEIDALKWDGAEVTNLETLLRTIDVEGYSHTMSMATRTDADTNYPAAYAAWNYTPKAPTGTTGWFLPSAQQWVKMMTGLGGLNEDQVKWGSFFDNGNTVVSNWVTALMKVGNDNYDTFNTSLVKYWSSSEHNKSGAVVVYIGTDDYGLMFHNQTKSYSEGIEIVRPVLAF